MSHLAQAAEQIPQGKEMWKPCDKCMPWLSLIHHMSIGRREIVLKTLKGERVDFPGCFSDPANYVDSPGQAAEVQWETWNELKSYLQAQPEDYAKSTVTFPGGFDMAVERMLWMIYEENIHHRGQAWVYARINGLTPPSIWGSEDWERNS